MLKSGWRHALCVPATCRIRQRAHQLLVLRALASFCPKPVYAQTRTAQLRLTEEICSSRSSSCLFSFAHTMAQSDSQGAQSGADKKIEPLEIHAWRRPYVREKQPFLLESEMPSKDPFEFFDAWFREVSAHGELSFEELNAAALSTVSDDGWPSCRIVLIKAYGDTQGFSFYTNYGSQKAKDLAANPRASILFHWPKVHWQVRIMGPVEQLSDELADQYWQKRPFDSQIGSAASEQSTVIASRDQLLERAKCLRATAEANKQTSIPRPKQWGGYVLRPRYFEFWQGQTDRLHDRIRFRRRDDGEMTEFTREGKNGWVYERLSP